MTEEKVLTPVEQAEQAARGYFKQGLNCSECVLAAFFDVHGTTLPREAITLCTGFGGGNLCGAVAGAVMALSTVVGREDPFAKASMDERICELQEDIYPKVAALIKDIEAEYGTLICRELCDPFGDFECKERKKNCMKLIGRCAALAEQHALIADEEKAQ